MKILLSIIIFLLHYSALLSSCIWAVHLCTGTVSAIVMRSRSLNVCGLNDATPDCVVTLMLGRFISDVGTACVLFLHRIVGEIRREVFSAVKNC